MTELGLLGLPFEEALGGFGGGGVETAIVMEAFGRALVLEPYFATVILGGGMLRRAASASVLGALAPRVAAGKLRLAFAHVERHSRYDLADVSTMARRDGASYILDGAKSVVIHGDSADQILLTARIAGERRARSGIGLFLVDPAASRCHAARLSHTRWLTGCRDYAERRQSWSRRPAERRCAAGNRTCDRRGHCSTVRRSCGRDCRQCMT